MPLQTEASSASTETRSASRRHPRHMFSVPIRLRHFRADGVEITRGVTLDISEGGIGAIVEADLHFGETVEIALPLHPTPFNAMAVVRYVRDDRSGFEFLGLSATQLQQIGAAAMA